MNPPPPPPHGEGAPKHSGLPPGNYDIFIIPPHSSGSGFLYLPSLKPNVNSFAAGFASALILVVVGSALAPVVQAWWTGVKGSGGTGMIMIMLAIGVGAWALGRAQNDGGAGLGGGGASPGAAPHGTSGGASGGAAHGASQGAPPPNPHASGAGPSAGPGAGTGTRMPGGGAEKPKPTWGRTNAGAGAGFGTGAGADPPNPNATKGGWEKAREETRRKEEERKAREAEKKAREEAERKLREAREREIREREAREREMREREARERKAREREAVEREREARERELRERGAREREMLEREAREKEMQEREAREREIREWEARERSEREKEKERERELERQREREALKKQLEEEALQKLREKEALKKEIEREILEKQRKEEALKKQREKEAQEKAQREAREKTQKEAQEKAQREAREKAQKEAKEKAQKEAQKEAPKDEPKVKSTYAFSSVGEKTNPWPKGHPNVLPIRPPPSPPKKPNPPPPPPATKTCPGTEGDRHSFRPYDKPKKPVRKKSLSSIYSESSYAASYTTGASTPPPSHRSTYSTKDPDKIVINAVYAFTNAFIRTPTSQLVSGIGSVTDGLILRITTEGLFIDDDVRGVPQREWDVKAWTMKLVEVWCPNFRNGTPASASRSATHPNPVRRLWNLDKEKAAMNEEADALLVDMLQTCKDSCRFASPSASSLPTKNSNKSRTGEPKSARLHVLRASIRDQEGKRYVFVLTEEESWKVAVGLQRLRRGTQVRALGVTSMSAADAKSTLDNLGWE